MLGNTLCGMRKQLIQPHDEAKDVYLGKQTHVRITCLATIFLSFLSCSETTKAPSGAL